ncbi:hypothetical protein GF386_00355 [Candidatus Pacearchaeota archaeon]|nr:hypothetical protein [Candidatus Pacearchaeota archaeon]MBD3282734.1 hypothetical protein [Candidatus Pacearchaeota archaeon]
MGKFYLISKKAQAWGMDLIIGFSIFIFVLSVFYIYSLNQSGGEINIIETLIYDGNLITNSIFSEGHPVEWNETNVTKIGILSDNKINETKLESFYNLTKNNYDKTKILFNTKYDYYFFIDPEFSFYDGKKEGIGKSGITRKNANQTSTNLIKITRFTVYKEKPVTAYLYIWDED